MRILAGIDIIHAPDFGVGGIGNGDAVEIGAVAEEEAKKVEERSAAAGVDQVNRICRGRIIAGTFLVINQLYGVQIGDALVCRPIGQQLTLRGGSTLALIALTNECSGSWRKELAASISRQSRIYKRNS